MEQVRWLVVVMLLFALAKGDDPLDDTEVTESDMTTMVPVPTPMFRNYTRQSLGLVLGYPCDTFMREYDPTLSTLKRICFCFLVICQRPLTPEEAIERKSFVDNAGKLLVKEAQRKRLKTYMPLIVINGVIGAAGLVGNLVIIIVIVAFMPRKSVVNVMIISMTSADFFVCGLCVPLITYSLARNSWEGGEFLCKFVWYFFFLAFSCSCISMTLISIERYIVICHPMKAPSINTLSHARKMAIGTWVFAILIAIPIIFITEFHPDTKGCQLVLINTDMALYYFFVILICIFFIPSSVMSFAYISVGIALMKSIKITTQMQHQGDEKAAKESEDIKKRISLVKTLVAVMIVFFILWGPVLIWYVLVCEKGLFMEDMAWAWMHYSLNTLSLAQSAINPFIYIGTSAQFRLGFRKLICLPPPPKKESTISGSTAISNISKTQTTETNNKV